MKWLQVGVCLTAIAATDSPLCRSVDYEKLDAELDPLVSALTNLTDQYPVSAMTFHHEIQLLIPLNVVLRHLFQLELVPSYPSHLPYLRRTHLVPPNFKEFHCLPQPPKTYRPGHLHRTPRQVAVDEQLRKARENERRFIESS